jgi:urease accessory protein
VGVGGPVGSGKTLLIERLVPRLMAVGRSVAIVTNDILTREDEQHVRAALGHLLEATRIVGVETGTCPHTAVREDPSMNLAVLAELEERHPDTDIVFLESGGDNLTLTFSPELVDHTIYVIDVAGGDKVPRKRGQGLVQADLLVVNKIDLAPYVGADLAVMRHDTDLVRDGRLAIFTNCRAEEGLEAVVAHLEAALIAYLDGSTPPGSRDFVRHLDLEHEHDHGHATPERARNT